MYICTMVIERLLTGMNPQVAKKKRRFYKRKCGFKQAGCHEDIVLTSWPPVG